MQLTTITVNYQTKITTIYSQYKLRFISKDKGNLCPLGKEKEDDPFWAEVYDGRIGTIVFGHEAFADTRLFPHAIGIDTGCVYGNKLTAVVYDLNSESPTFVSVNSKVQYAQSYKPLSH